MSFLLWLLVVSITMFAPSNSAEAPPQVVFAQIGNSVTIPRKIWGQKDVIYVNWHFNDSPLISRNPTISTTKVDNNWNGRLLLSNDFSLIITNVNLSDFGIFKCEQHERAITIMTSYKLYQVTMPKPSPLLAGASLSLSCEINKEGFNLVHPKIKWLGPDKKYRPGISNWNVYHLSVPNVTNIHTGQWTCEVNYGDHATLYATTDVIIVDLSPSPPSPIYTVHSSTDLPIPCSLSSIIQWSTVTDLGVIGGSWTFTQPNHPKSSLLLKLHLNPSPTWKVPNGTDTLLMETKVNNHVLDAKISRVSIKNRGTYTCRLQFKSRTLESSVRIEVLQVSSSPVKVYEGNALNLTCTLGHPMTSDLKLNWIAPTSSSLSNLRPTQPTELYISEVSMKDRGKWTCQLKKNATVLTSATVTVQIEKVPVKTWLIVAIVVVLAIVLSVVITVFIIRKRGQVSYRRRKRRFCCCKNPQVKGFYKT